MAQQPPSGPGPPHYRGFTITPRHTTLGKTPLYECSARGKGLYLTTQETDIHVPSGIWTLNPRKRAAADSCLRSRGKWDRFSHTWISEICCEISNKLIYLNVEDADVTKWVWGVGDTVVFLSSMAPYFLNPDFLECFNYGPSESL
jgi:hypothetical protein